ncbi:hypothetical protein Bpfe_028817 [Biomphalaria pfeifferi]|uniref:Uncharacterized protein n=1 Tax=Biomphalaria pfeifferi TaxID=112525 RepID=A0AAD8AVJ1_BIOPF|nr:hypothetical protein Bpfe_028817 [Biomphalaria pfeifferi]
MKVMARLCRNVLTVKCLKYMVMTLTVWTTMLIGFYAKSWGITMMSLFEWEQIESQSALPNTKQKCIHPQLLINDSTMTRHLRTLSPEKCPDELEWVYVENGTIRFTKLAVSRFKGMSCSFVPLYRDGDYNVKWGRPILNIQNGFRIPTDFFRVYCSSVSRTFNGLFAGVAHTEERAERKDLPMDKGFGGLGIAILGFDSMSRMSWLRRLKKTREYFLGELGAIELEEHNVLGDGTTAVMFPMLTGKFEWELPDARRFFPNATTLDDFPFIWNDLKKFGYLTSWCNAENITAPFNWRMLGFKNQPTDFYSRPFFMVAKPYQVYVGRSRKLKMKKYCIGSRTYSLVWLNYFKDIFVSYPNKRKFLLHFLVDMSHDDNNLITMMDLDIRDVVKFLYDNNYLNNTLLILMGDHGARYDKARHTWAGKMEERIPYFSLLFPKWFQKKYPEAMANVRKNSKRLTTPFDLYETFRDFIHFTGTGNGDVSRRGISLFKEIPLERSCEQADIAAHWCACLASKKVNLKEDIYASTALSVAMDTINNLTSQYRDICENLSVFQVKDAIKMETRKDVLQFSNTDSVGGIYNITFKAKNQNLMSLYQLTFSTVPGMALYEVTVVHDILRNHFFLSEKEISRINKYGDTSSCILNKNRQLRQYCYCSKQTSSWGINLF